MATPHERMGLSRSQVDRAGEILRVWTLKGLLAGPAEQDASRVVNAYRSEFKSPLRSVVMGLRSAVRTAGVEVVVAERLKRQPRLVGKLIRFPNIRLTQMQNVAGCRAILPNLAAVDEVRRRIERQESEIVRSTTTTRPRDRAATAPSTSSLGATERWSRYNCERLASRAGRCSSRISTPHIGSS